jgi:radical SAM protein with 4Fe4S-binding SPASM domain
MKLTETKTFKIIRSKDYNSNFNKKNGVFQRWGSTFEEDPLYSPFGPEIADVEIGTICHGLEFPCSFCYKSNSFKGKYMNLETFKRVFDNLTSPNKVLNQIAFGLGDIDSNPDIWDIFKHCRENEVIPNITINGARLSEEILDNLVKYCGAVAVSRYEISDYCYNAVEALTKKGLKQVNIHMLLSSETYEDCFNVIDDVKKDSRLENLNAIVFLSLKPKGRGKSFSCLRNDKDYKALIDYAFEKEVSIGFDSCSAPLFLDAVKDHEDYKVFENLVEPCESNLFSIYVDVNGKTVPCSFLSNEWEEIDLTKENMKLEEWWNSELTKRWREKLLATATTKDPLVYGCRQCPVFDIY